MNGANTALFLPLESKREGQTDRWMETLAMVFSAAEATFPCALLAQPFPTESAHSILKMEWKLRTNSRKNYWGDELLRKFTYRLMQGLIQPSPLTGGVTVIYPDPTSCRGCCGCLGNFQWNVWYVCDIKKPNQPKKNKNKNQTTKNPNKQTNKKKPNDLSSEMKYASAVIVHWFQSLYSYVLGFTVSY